jgi:hypothetical protein
VRRNPFNDFIPGQCSSRDLCTRKQDGSATGGERYREFGWFVVRHDVISASGLQTRLIDGTVTHARSRDGKPTDRFSKLRGSLRVCIKYTRTINRIVDCVFFFLHNICCKLHFMPLLQYYCNSFVLPVETHILLFFAFEAPGTE